VVVVVVDRWWLVVVLRSRYINSMLDRYDGNGLLLATTNCQLSGKFPDLILKGRFSLICNTKLSWQLLLE
jgi:hypothetical protein